MNSSSNTTSFATLTGTYPAVKLASGLAANTDTLIVSGATNASIVLDVLFRNLDGSNARNFDIIICPTSSNATDYYNRAQISVPANSGNNGSAALASLASLMPTFFDLDLAGNRVLTLEGGISIYVRNKAALTADIYVMVKLRSF
ncbi:hypothetical protein [Mucilaginibacter xinganensis]|uniref:Uncharacterized protein n=1 Tax=Mucilaginibacter xinganensis TaxID=1234841 RepID=A0A223NTF2_9SPHI|nr:hypothetical protein [Mucilaginibacter xinganensis]ASU33143.1 hypothetical protein MuYL_1245 [Mucilaginibacter xinganensis]